MKANARHRSGTKVSRMQPGSVGLVYIKRVSYMKNSSKYYLLARNQLWKQNYDDPRAP